MRISLGFLLLLSLVSPFPVMGQEWPDAILSQAVSLDDWGVRAVDGARFGRLALVQATEGPRLELRRLAEVEPDLSPPGFRSRVPHFDGTTLVVSDFARGNRSSLGGYFGTFQRTPSEARATVARTSDGRRALELTCRQHAEGFCGLWVQLFDFDVPPAERWYLDARGFSTLSVWVRGRVGGEKVLLKMADRDWELREDALPVGEISDFLPSGRVETQWQQALVPLNRFPARVRRDMLAMVVFEVRFPGTTAIELGPIAFSQEQGSSPSLPPPAKAEQPAKLPHKATWVWNTAELLRDPLHADSLLNFLEQEGFDRVFLQLPGIPEASALPGELAVDTEEMRPLVAAFMVRGMRVYALDGFARYALPEYHAGVLRTIDHVARYNAEVNDQERFYGVRHDIEPYLLPGFHGPNRATLLLGLLELTSASVGRAHAAGLVYGADIPFWYDAVSEDTHQRTTVRYGGVEKSVSEHLIDLVDDVAIMDYRTTPYGSDGTLRHGIGEIRYGKERGKSVFIALETHALPDEVLLDFRGPSEKKLPSSPQGALVVLAPAGDSVVSALLPIFPTPSEASEALSVWLDQNRIDAGSVRWWPLGRRAEVPASKITFAGQDPTHLNRVMDATAGEFGKYTSFAGFAIHHAESYRALILDPIHHSRK